MVRIKNLQICKRENETSDDCIKSKVLFNDYGPDILGFIEIPEKKDDIESSLLEVLSNIDAKITDENKEKIKGIISSIDSIEWRDFNSCFDEEEVSEIIEEGDENIGGYYSYWVYNYNKATGQDNINKIFKKLEKGCFVEIRDFLYDDKKKKTRRKK